MSEVAIDRVGEIFPRGRMTLQQPASIIQRQTSTRNEVWMTDLVLHKVLDYVVEGENYVSISLVCKRWKTLLETRFPPTAAYHLLLLMERGCILQREHVQVLVKVFESLRDRSCPMYRLKASNGAWPRLQSRFRARLMNVAYEMCVQRSPNNLSQQVYESTCCFMDSNAALAAETMQETIAQGQCFKSWNQVLPFLHQLIKQWLAWEGGVSIVTGLTKYVNRCPWVRFPAQDLARRNLTAEQTASASMAYQMADYLIESCGCCKKLREAKPLLVSFLLEDDKKATFRERALALMACQLCRNVSDFPSTPTTSKGTIELPPVFNPVLLGVDEAAVLYLLAMISNST